MFCSSVGVQTTCSVAESVNKLISWLNYLIFWVRLSSRTRCSPFYRPFRGALSIIQPYSVGTGGYFQEIKAAGACSGPSRTEVNNARSNNTSPLPSFAFLARWLIKLGGIVTLLLLSSSFRFPCASYLMIVFNQYK